MTRMERLRGCVLVAVFLGLAGCASTPVQPSSADDGGAVAASATTQPANPPTQAPVTPPPPPSPEEVAAGHASFDRACGSCHDKTKSKTWFAPALADTKLDEAFVRRKIRQDGGPAGDSPRMQAISTDVLPEGEVPALIAYLRSIRAVSP